MQRSRGCRRGNWRLLRGCAHLARNRQPQPHPKADNYPHFGSLLLGFDALSPCRASHFHAENETRIRTCKCTLPWLNRHQKRCTLPRYQAKRVGFMDTAKLRTTALAMVADNKGLLAMDESTPTANKRFDAAGIPQNEQTRRAYRDMIVTTSGIAECLNGAI